MKSCRELLWVGMLVAMQCIADEPRTINGVVFSSDELSDLLRMSLMPARTHDETNACAGMEDAARFGEHLFFDSRLSGSGRIACASCHQPQRNWTDGKRVSVGVGTGTRNTPALWNIAARRWYFWDGRAATLWSQALKPIEDPLEMGGSRKAVAELIRADKVYCGQYEAIFGAIARHDVNQVFANIGKCIAAFEEQIVSNKSRLDQFAAYVRNSDAKIVPSFSSRETRGLKLFLSKAKCVTCHFGPLLSDDDFHDLLLPKTGGPRSTDRGRYDGLHLLKTDEFAPDSKYSDKPDGRAAMEVKIARLGSDNWGKFKTPSLRNVAKTAPYMHGGQYNTLIQVVEHYSTLHDMVVVGHHSEDVLVPLNLSKHEKTDLVAFLETLTDSNTTWDIAGIYEKLGPPASDRNR